MAEKTEKILEAVLAELKKSNEQNDKGRDEIIKTFKTPDPDEEPASQKRETERKSLNLQMKGFRSAIEKGFGNVIQKTGLTKAMGILKTGVKGVLMGALLVAFLAFVNSPFFDKFLDFFRDKIVPSLGKLIDWIDKNSGVFTAGFDLILDGLKAVGNLFVDMVCFLQNPSWDTFKKLIGDNIVTLGLATALLAPSLMLGGLYLGIKLFGKALDLLGRDLGRVKVPKVPKVPTVPTAPLPRTQTPRTSGPAAPRMSPHPRIARIVPPIATYGKAGGFGGRTQGPGASSGSSASSLGGRITHPGMRGPKFTQFGGQMAQVHSALARMSPKQLDAVRAANPDLRFTKTAGGSVNISGPRGQIVSYERIASIKGAGGGIIARSQTAMQTRSQQNQQKLSNFLKKFPRLNGFLRLMPMIGYGYLAALAYSIANDPNISDRDKKVQLTGILSGVLASLIGAKGGFALGMLGGPFAALIGAGLGGLLSFYAGRDLGQLAMRFMLGEDINVEDIIPDHLSAADLGKHTLSSLKTLGSKIAAGDHATSAKRFAAAMAQKTGRRFQGRGGLQFNKLSPAAQTAIMTSVRKKMQDLSPGLSNMDRVLRERSMIEKMLTAVETDINLGASGVTIGNQHFNNITNNQRNTHAHINNPILNPNPVLQHLAGHHGL